METATANLGRLGHPVQLAREALLVHEVQVVGLEQLDVLGRLVPPDGMDALERLDVKGCLDGTAGLELQEPQVLYT